MIKTNEKTNTIFPINKIIFKKYKVLNLISKGVFGGIYLVINEKTSERYAMKIEKRDSRFRLLEQEGYNLFSVKGLGIPELISFGRIKDYSILIEELLGKSLNQMFIENNFKFSLKDICLISIQLIERIELIHSKTLIHRDIKPENFLIGYKNPNIIYLTEFGLCAKFCSSKTKKHILPGFRGTFTGTLRYSSANAQRGNQQSRRDDLESLGYTILFFMKGSLPWMNLEHIINEKELYLKTYSMKKFITAERLCRGLPSEIEEYFKYVKLLKFQEEPNYDYLRSLFIDLLKKNGYEDYESLTFSWVTPSNLIKSKKMKKKFGSPFGRLYQKIKSHMESQKSNSQIEYSNTNNNQKINRNKTFGSFPPNTEKQLLNISDQIVIQPNHNINNPNGFNQNSNLDKEHKVIFTNKEIFAKKNKLVKKEDGCYPPKFETQYYYKINNNKFNTNKNNNNINININKRYNERKIPYAYKKINNYNNYSNYTKMENSDILNKIANTNVRKININTYNSNQNSGNSSEIKPRKVNALNSQMNLNSNHLKLIKNNANDYLISNDKFKLNNQLSQNMKMRNEFLNSSHKPINSNWEGRNFYYYKQNFMMMNNSDHNQNNSNFVNTKLYSSNHH